MTQESKKGCNVPNLRFPDFSESAYSKYRFEDIFNFSTGKNIKQSEASPDFETPCVRYGELYHMYKEVIHEVINRTNLNRNDLLFSSGDEILLPSAGEDPLDIGSASALTIPNVAIGRTINILRPKIESLYSQIFVSYYINQKLKKKISSLAKGVSISNVYNSDLKKLSITLPPLPEQNKTADFLFILDRRINTQSKIIEDWKSFKKTLSKKIFSQEYRFAEFTEEWKKKELGYFLSKPSKGYSKRIDINKILTVKLHLKGIAINDRTDTLKIGATKYLKRKKGQFIYGKQNLFNGAFGIIPEEFDGFLSSGDIPTLDIDNSKVNSEFLLQYFSQHSFYKRLEAIASGSGSKRIHEDTLLLQKVKFPSLQEQNKIAYTLSNIDQKIELETKYLDLLSKQKQYFLQNLFI